MNGKRRFFQIALELKTRGLDKLLVLRFFGLDGILSEICEVPDGAQVDIEHHVGVRQKAGGFRGGALAEVDGISDGRYDEQHDHEHDQIPGTRPHKWGRSNFAGG
jgi:hypothetical protein